MRLDTWRAPTRQPYLPTSADGSCCYQGRMSQLGPTGTTYSPGPLHPICPVTMFTNYMPNPVAPTIFPKRIRLTLKGPERPIAVRKEHIPDSKTTLILRPQGDAHSAAAYKVTDEDGLTHFTATGQKFGDRTCREFRDASGLPLFELHRRTSLRSHWSVTLPGSNAANIATGSSLGMNMRAVCFTITFENVAAVDSKKKEDRMLTLQIEKHGNVLVTFDVVDGNRKVSEIRESIPHNRKLALMPESRERYRPVFDITVAPGVDMSLVSFMLLCRVHGLTCCSRL